MSRNTRITYLPDSGVEPGRDGRTRSRRYEAIDYYDGDRRGTEMRRGYDRDGGWEVRPIGFERDPYARRYGGVRMGGSRSGGEYERGYGRYEETDCLSWEDAKEWMMSIRNADGSKGAHWSIEQTNKLFEKKQLDCAQHEFWAAMNMLYSDYAPVAKKFGVDNPDFFACLAEAFLDDEDAVGDKLAVYYDYIVEH